MALQEFVHTEKKVVHVGHLKKLIGNGIANAVYVDGKLCFIDNPKQSNYPHQIGFRILYDSIATIDIMWWQFQRAKVIDANTVTLSIRDVRVTMQFVSIELLKVPAVFSF
ncbi:MAG: hypothetical protein WCM93_14410 [Bacteroidota bacterium]